MTENFSGEEKQVISEIYHVQNRVVKYARKEGWLAWKMRIDGRRGCPDYWFFKNSKVVIMEFKRPGAKPSAQQEKRISELRSQGFEVHVVDDPLIGRNILDGSV